MNRRFSSPSGNRPSQSALRRVVSAMLRGACVGRRLDVLAAATAATMNARMIGRIMRHDGVVDGRRNFAGTSGSLAWTMLRCWLPAGCRSASRLVGGVSRSDGFRSRTSEPAGTGLRSWTVARPRGLLLLTQRRLRATPRLQPRFGANGQQRAATIKPAAPPPACVARPTLFARTCWLLSAPRCGAASTVRKSSVPALAPG